jgi:uncharacterized membrane protein YeiB
MPGGTGGEVKPRIAGIDLARCLAITGMLAVHLGPTRLTDPVGRLYAVLVHGRASILFAVLAGIGVSLLARSRSATLAETRLRLLWQATLLLPLGLWLQSLDITVLVIISNYALLFVLGAACVSLRDRTIAALGLTSAAFGPPAFLLGRIHDPRTFDRSAVTWSEPPLDVLHGLLFSGPYPLITWAAPFLLGMLIGRRDLRNGRLRVALVIGGAGLAVMAALAAMSLQWVFGPPPDPANWYRLTVARPHSQMPLWMIGSIGSALLALGLSLFVADLLGRWSWPFVATGQASLSIYVGHLLALHWLGQGLKSSEVGGAVAIVALVMAIAAVSAMIWRAFLPRGPLESLLALPWTVVRRHRRSGSIGSAASAAKHRST